MPHQERIDSVARRAGQLAYDHAFLAQQPIDERRLPDVGPADYRDANLVGLRALAFLRW